VVADVDEVTNKQDQTYRYASSYTET